MVSIATPVSVYLGSTSYNIIVTLCVCVCVCVCVCRIFQFERFGMSRKRALCSLEEANGALVSVCDVCDMCDVCDAVARLVRHSTHCQLPSR